MLNPSRNKCQSATFRIGEIWIPSEMHSLGPFGDGFKRKSGVSSIPRRSPYHPRKSMARNPEREP